MINGKSIIGIITARGGSKGIPGKNIKLIAGKPLIAWTIEEANKSKYIDRLILSSEDVNIIRVAKEWGCEVPFIRPQELALDDTPGIDPVINALNELREKYYYTCLLQPTSPLRKAKHIDEVIELCEEMHTDSCVSMVEVSKPPQWIFRMDNLYKITPFLKGKELVRRQDADKLYSLNGSVYLMKTQKLLETKSFIISNTIGYIMDKISSIDIDDIIDFNIVEYFLKNES